MTTLHPMPDDVVLVAIDIAKARNEVLIEVPGAKRRRRMTVLNTREEHERLIALLFDLGRPVACAFEATGNYHRPIAWRLREAGFDVRLVSSVALAQTRKALHNGWDKNDPNDAQVILHMLRIGAPLAYHDPLAAGINDVQELSKTHEAISGAKTQVLHRIQTHYLPLFFPEVERFRQNSRSDWFFAFLDRFPTPASIVALIKEAFVEAAWTVVGRKVSKARLLGDIYETAKTSIGLPIPVDAPAMKWLEGASRLRTVWDVFGPMAMPAIKVTALFTFIAAWNEFVIATTLLRDAGSYTLPIRVFAEGAGRYQVQWQTVMAAALVATLPVSLVFSWMQRYLVTGLGAGAVK